MTKTDASDLSGTRLGRYEIVSLLGQGGMGAVYDAIDPTLDRHVALKILPAAAVADPQRANRFVTEARAASALNHPHVVSIYEIGEADGVHYIAMERVDGVTLRSLLAGPRLPLGRAVGILADVAEAVAAAHSAGVVHRDLKPENIMMARGGYPKVLDFGLAKLRPSESWSENGATPIATTASGVILGTAGYMSPEQARGREVDHRSDIFALGCILYESVSGRRAFAGGSHVETLQKIISEEPEPLPGIPGELQRIIRKSMANRESLQAWSDQHTLRCASYEGRPPGAAVAIIHTHPNALPYPSVDDELTAARTGLPVWVVTRMMITVTTGHGVQRFRIGDWNPEARRGAVPSVCSAQVAGAGAAAR